MEASTAGGGEPGHHSSSPASVTVPRHRALQWSRIGYALALALLVVAPLASPGYLLIRDAVSTPRSYLSDRALGLASAPRATPQDFAVALASHCIDGGVVVKVLLVVGLWLAGWGAARLVAMVLPESGAGGQFVAITLAIWNPYVGERLLQGHWSLLLGYGCLPWVATAMLALRSAGGSRRRRLSQLFGLAFWIALAGLTPTGLMLAATVGLACAAVPVEGSGGHWPRWLCLTVALGDAVVAALPWLTASVLGSSSADHIGAQAPDVVPFAARAEPGLSTLGSLASLGGIWNGDAVPGTRATLFAVESAVVLLAVVATGLPALTRRRAAAPLVLLAAAAVLIPAAMATGPGLAVLRAAVDAAPGLGVVRDGQKWVALAMPGYVLASAGAVLTLRRWLQPAVTALACSAALVLSLPDLAWGVWGKVEPVHYPPEWPTVAAAINSDPREPGAVAVLPIGTMRHFTWAGPAPVLDPLARWVRADVLTTGDLIVSGALLPGEGSRARHIQRLLLAGADPVALSRAGVTWLVVEASTPGDMGLAPKTFEQLPAVYRGGDLTLYRIGGHAAGAPPDQRLAVIIAHLMWLTMLAGGAIGATAAAWRQPIQGQGGRVA